MTIVTAMVSPRARPSARIVAPKMPARAEGRITRQVVSHHVAPSATALSFNPRGTALITSREIADSVGRIITASTSDALNKLLTPGCDSQPMKPKRSEIGPSRCSYDHGASTHSPQMPYTPLGMGARAWGVAGRGEARRGAELERRGRGGRLSEHADMRVARVATGRELVAPGVFERDVGGVHAARESQAVGKEVEVAGSQLGVSPS